MAFVAFSDICNHNALCRKCIPLGKNIIRECFQIFTIKMLSTNTFSYLQQHFPMNKDQILNVWSLYCIFSLGKISHQLFMVFLQKHHMITFYENDGIRESWWRDLCFHGPFARGREDARLRSNLFWLGKMIRIWLYDKILISSDDLKA